MSILGDEISNIVDSIDPSSFSYNQGQEIVYEEVSSGDRDQYDYEYKDGYKEEEEDKEEEEYSSDEESIDSDLALINAQLQWEESLQQLTTLLNIVILPLIGKVIGRRFAGIIWRKAWDYFTV